MRTVVLVLLMKGFSECDGVKTTGDNPDQEPCTCRKLDGTICEDAEVVATTYTSRRCKLPAHCCLLGNNQACSVKCAEDDHGRNSFHFARNPTSSPTLSPTVILTT